MYDKILDRYSEIKGRRMNEEIEAFITLCKVMGYDVYDADIINKSIRFEIDGCIFVIHCDGKLTYTRLTTDYYYDFNVSCKKIEEKEIFELVLNKDLDKIIEFKYRMGIMEDKFGVRIG